MWSAPSFLVLLWMMSGRRKRIQEHLYISTYWKIGYTQNNKFVHIKFAIQLDLFDCLSQKAHCLSFSAAACFDYPSGGSWSCCLLLKNHNDLKCFIHLFSGRDATSPTSRFNGKKTSSTRRKSKQVVQYNLWNSLLPGFGRQLLASLPVVIALSPNSLIFS